MLITKPLFYSVSFREGGGGAKRMTVTFLLRCLIQSPAVGLALEQMPSSFESLPLLFP